MESFNPNMELTTDVSVGATMCKSEDSISKSGFQTKLEQLKEGLRNKFYEFEVFSIREISKFVHGSAPCKTSKDLREKAILVSNIKYLKDALDNVKYRIKLLDSVSTYSETEFVRIGLLLDKELLSLLQ